jgi:hypothetical protein
MKKKVLIILTGLLTVLFACSAGGGKPLAGVYQETANPPESDKTPRREELCFRFFDENMLLEDGGVRTNYLDKTENDELATGAQVLSESMGLWMLYAVETKNQPAFDRSFAFVKARLDTKGILSYRYAPPLGAYPVNAYIDDMRIIRSLLLADGAFGGGYKETALAYANRLYETNVAENRVRDFYDAQAGIANDFVTLCYPDFDTMKKLAEHDKKWQAVYDEMLGIVKGGYLGDDFPMYAGTYSYQEGTYYANDISTVQSLLTVLNLARVGESSQSSIDFIRENVKSGTLYGSYGTDGTAKNKVESTAIYAICADIGKTVGDEALYETAITQMNRFQVLDENSKVFGAFANAQTLDLYAFDNLMALLAYRA